MSHYVYLPLAEISIDGGTQARAEINMATVAEYADALSEGETLPPALVFFDGAKHHLADGFHRFHANAKIGAVSMECEIRTGTRRDAVLFSVGANDSHGLRRCSADKQKSVMTLLADPEWSKWSDRAIAKECKVDGKTVAAQRRAICGNSADAPTARTVERNGKTYTQDTAGQKKAGKERAEKPADVEPKSPDPAAAPAPPADEYDDMVEDDAPSSAGAAPAVDPRDSQIKALESKVEYYEAALAAELAENTRIGNVLDADDKVAAAMASNAELAEKNKQLTALLKTANERVNGLMFELQQMTSLVKTRDRQIAKLQRVAA